jgi:hypothetical protein
VKPHEVVCATLEHIARNPPALPKGGFNAVLYADGEVVLYCHVCRAGDDTWRQAEARVTGEGKAVAGG